MNEAKILTLQECIHSKHNGMIIDGRCGKGVMGVGNKDRGKLMRGSLWGWIKIKYYDLRGKFIQTSGSELKQKQHILKCQVGILSLQPAGFPWAFLTGQV